MNKVKTAVCFVSCPMLPGQVSDHASSEFSLVSAEACHQQWLDTANTRMRQSSQGCFEVLMGIA